MNVTDYFLPLAADEADLSAWSPILPSPARPLRTNLFGDAFLIDTDGAVHMLDRSGCSTEFIAASEDDFWSEIQEDSAAWQLRVLADECRRTGMLLGDGQCYAFTTPTVLGGEYAVANVWVASWQEWFSVTADLFQQLKDLPNATTVSLNVMS
jgi:hypothetical protein